MHVLWSLNVHLSFILTSQNAGKNDVSQKEIVHQIEKYCFRVKIEIITIFIYQLWCVCFMACAIFYLYFL